MPYFPPPQEEKKVVETVLKVDNGEAATQFPDFLLRLDFGRNGATINPEGTP